MTDLQDLYQELILDHGRKPRNFKPLEAASGTAEGYNPLCGDKVKIYVKMADDIVKDISFEGAGCAISTASASLGVVGVGVSMRDACIVRSTR